MSLEDLEILGTSGKGVHGEVSRVRHEGTGTVLAMKEVQLERVMTKSSCQQIVRYGAVQPEPWAVFRRSACAVPHVLSSIVPQRA